MVKAIRIFFDKYHSIDRAKVSNGSTFKELIKHPDEDTKGLFLVALIDDNTGFGGEWVTIVFRSKPNAIMRVWFKHGNVVAVVDAKMSANEKRAFVEHMGIFWNESKFWV